MNYARNNGVNNGVNLSSLLSATVDEVRENGRNAIIYCVVMAAITGFFQLGFGSVAPNVIDATSFLNMSVFSQGAIGVLAGVVGAVLYLLAGYWLMAGMLNRTQSPSFDAFAPFVGITILSSIIIALGFVALIIPGIILTVRYITLLPIAISGDGPAMGSFGAAWDMSRGYGWSIFGAYVIIYLAMLALTTLTGGVGGLGGGVGSAVLGAVTSGFSSVAFTGLSVAAYRMMRDSTEELTQVFE